MVRIQMGEDRNIKRGKRAGCVDRIFINMMTSSNGSISRRTVPLWKESTGHRWIPIIKATDAELCCFLWTAPEQTFEQTIETPVIWFNIALIMTSLYGKISEQMHNPLGAETRIFRET